MSRETERSKTVYGIYIRKKNDGFKTFRAALPRPFRSMQEIHPSMILYLDHSRALAPLSKDLLFVFHPIPQTPHTRHSNNQHTCYVHKENRRRLHAQRFCTSSTTRAFQGSCEQPSTLHSLHATFPHLSHCTVPLPLVLTVIVHSLIHTHRSPRGRGGLPECATLSLAHVTRRSPHTCGVWIPLAERPAAGDVGRA